MNTMDLFILSESKSIANNFIAELRDKHIQSDGLRFRKNMERIGEILAYEISKHLEYHNTTVHTPLGEASTPILASDPYLITILRAGIPFFQGFLNFFDKAECGFIGAFRSNHTPDQGFEIDMEYQAIGDIYDKEVILIDPMLATGKSIVKALQHLLIKGKPSRIHIASLIAAKQGYDYVKNCIDFNMHFWIGTIDEELNDKSYIVPGLGDAGDLSFGKKS